MKNNIKLKVIHRNEELVEGLKNLLVDYDRQETELLDVRCELQEKNEEIKELREEIRLLELQRDAKQLKLTRKILKKKIHTPQEQEQEQQLATNE